MPNCCAISVNGMLSAHSVPFRYEKCGMVNRVYGFSDVLASGFAGVLACGWTGAGCVVTAGIPWVGLAPGMYKGPRCPQAASVLASTTVVAIVASRVKTKYGFTIRIKVGG